MSCPIFRPALKCLGMFCSAVTAALILFSVGCLAVMDLSDDNYKEAEIQAVIAPYYPQDLKGRLVHEYDQTIPRLDWPRVALTGEWVQWGAWATRDPGDLNPIYADPAAWQVNLGTINSNGTYTAPTTPGMEKISARVAMDGTYIEDAFEIIDLPIIISFFADETSVPAGNTIRLSWEVHTGQAEGLPIRIPKMSLEGAGIHISDVNSINPIINGNRISGWLNATILESGVITLSVTNARNKTITSEIEVECI